MRGRQRRPLVLLVLASLLLVPVTVQAQSPDPSPALSPAPEVTTGVVDPDRVASLMAGMSLRERVGQLFMSRVYGFRAKDPAPGARRSNRRYLGVADASELFARYPVGGIVYFDYTGNLQSPEQVARLSNAIQRAARDAGAPAVLIATDQEHGSIERLGPPATRFPGAMAVGAARDDALAREAARVSGEELRAVGIDQALAPVADVNSDPANPVIGVRAFGSRSSLVSRMVAAQVRGLQDDAGVAATAKHFPGHGDTDLDSHTTLPTIGRSREEWWRVDAPPFEAAIEAGIGAIMTAHVRVPALDPSGRPATLSGPMLTGILRGRMGYDGVIMTDSLTMAALRGRYGEEQVPVLAVQAGADILADPLYLPTAFKAVMAAVRDGRISRGRLDQSVERILRLKDRLVLLDDPFVQVEEVAGTLGADRNQAVAQAVGEASVTVLRDREGWLPLPARWRLLLTGTRPDGARATADELRDEVRKLTVSWTGSDPGAGRISRAIRDAGRHDLTVVLTEHLRAYPGQRELVRRLLASGERVLVVLGGSPYDATWFPGAPAQVATYGTVPASMQGLARVLTGAVAASGSLPVAIPRFGRTSEALFPFGHGLETRRRAGSGGGAGEDGRTER